MKRSGRFPLHEWKRVIRDFIVLRLSILQQINIESLFAETEGSRSLAIGMIDGAVDASHSAFSGSDIRYVNGNDNVSCRNMDSLACEHGTLVAGILTSARGLDLPAICPGCPLLVRAIFCEAANFDDYPLVAMDELAGAIREMIVADIKIINLSVGLSSRTSEPSPNLRAVYDYARKRTCPSSLRAEIRQGLPSTRCFHIRG